MTFELVKCPRCKSSLTYPDKPSRDKCGGRTVIVDIPCPRCPTVTTVFEDTGRLCYFTMTFIVGPQVRNP